MRAYQINGRNVTPEEFASTISDLLANGWTLTPPSTFNENDTCAMNVTDPHENEVE